jgi:hypothetical protein
MNLATRSSIFLEVSSTALGLLLEGYAYLRDFVRAVILGGDGTLGRTHVLDDLLGFVVFGAQFPSRLNTTNA